MAARKVRKHSRQEWYQDRELRERLHGVCRHEPDEDPVHTQAVASKIVERILILPTNQRIATYLCRVEEWKAAEIAELLNIAPATAYVHIHEGTLKVRRSEEVRKDHSAPAAAGTHYIDYIPAQQFAISEFLAAEEKAHRRRLLGAVISVLLILALLIGSYWLAPWLVGAVSGVLVLQG